MGTNRQKLERAEDYVRDVLRIMGQPNDADNPILVTRVALQVMAAFDAPGATALNWVRCQDDLPPERI